MVHSDNMENLFFSLQIKATSIGWSLGYMLSVSNMIPSEVKEIPPMTNPVFAGLIFLFSALTIITVVIAFIILVRACFWERKLQREWSTTVSLGGCCNPVSSTTVACSRTLKLKVTNEKVLGFFFILSQLLPSVSIIRVCKHLKMKTVHPKSVSESPS